MRDLPPAFAAHCAGGVTTLCRCWSLRRRDGVALGFTDHDRDLTFAGLVHAARTGLEAAEASAEGGFAVSGGDVAGALSSLGLTEADIAGGLYDGASVETWLVDWTPRRRASSSTSARSARSAARTRPSWPSCAGSPPASTPKSGAATGRPAAPCWGMPAAGWTSRRGGGRAASSPCRSRPPCAWPSTALSRTGCSRAGASPGPAGPMQALCRPAIARGRSRGIVGGAAAPGGGGGHVHPHGRLRQAPRHLPRPLRQRGELPGLPAHAGNDTLLHGVPGSAPVLDGGSYFR